jgi:hypothetical protein
MHHRGEAGAEELRLDGAALKGCRFKGRMTGCVFGPWRSHKQDWEFGAVEDCDFTGARLSNVEQFDFIVH